MSLRFGTDGWRAVIGDEYTFENVSRVSTSIARVMKARAGSGPAVVGHDTRFLSCRFAETAAARLLAEGWPVQITTDPCPTPATSCQVVETGAAFGLMVTASHNPAKFNGIKIKDASGASATEEITSACESALPDSAPGAAVRGELERAENEGRLTRVSFRDAHVSRLSRIVDPEPLRGAGLHVVFDSMHGSAGSLLADLLGGGSTRVNSLRAEADPLFGGMAPEPIESRLDRLRAEVLASGADAGFATDGDGDRIGAFDENGHFVSPLRLAPLIAWNLLKAGRRGPLGKTFANTILLDRIARRYELPFKTFPVGFKYLAAELREGRMLLGGEESGGIGVEGYLPERDGVLVALLVLSAMRQEGKPLSALVGELCAEFGELHYRRRDLECAPDRARAFVEDLKRRPPNQIGGFAITGVDARDGLKLLFGDEGWLLFRGSGTEPVLRIYCEAPSVGALDAIMREASDLVRT